MSEENPNSFTETISLNSSLNDIIKGLLSKIEKMKANVNNINNDPSDELFNTCFNQMIKSIEKITTIISNNINFLTDTKLFKNDFHKAVSTIGIAIDSYTKSFDSITENRPESSEIIIKIKNDIINFSQSLTVFSTNILEIMQNIIEADKSKESKDEHHYILNIRLGLESSLFNLSVKVQPTDEFPFFKSNFLGVYRCYDTINNITEPITAIQSFCGTGKTSVIPLIILCRNLKDNLQVPFLILTEPSPKHVENIAKFFNSIVSQYVTIITDSNKFIEIVNEREKNPKNQEKLIFAILTPHKLLPLLHKLRENRTFYDSTRFIIDEIHQRTFHLDVLITQISEIESFKIPINVILMSASIYGKLLKPFNGKVTITSLIKTSQYEVVEKPPIMEHFIDKINDEVVRDEAIKVIEEMAKIRPTIERGHILCFLNLVRVCNNVNNSVLTLLNDNEETEDRRKIVFLRTTLKSNESIDSFFKRLLNEYEINEELRKANINNYKHEFFYVIPLVFSGVAEDAISELALNEFPGELKKITKLICSTPLSESFNYEGLSVVIDSGLVKQPGFDVKTSLTTMVETQASKETMMQRKGRLGRSMKGLYISILVNKDQPEIQVPPIQRLDLTTNILLMKEIEIDFEKISKNLPDLPNQENVDFALKNLVKIKAISEENSQITPLGRELLKFPFISVYYAAAVHKMMEMFHPDDQNNAYFIGVYLAAIISMDNLLVEEDMSENLSRYFCEDSDIVTLFNALNHLFKSDEQIEMKDLVESFGFSYSNFLHLKDHIQKVADITHPGNDIKEVFPITDKFISKNSIMKIIDLLIKGIQIIDPNWSDIHHIKFNKVKGAGGLKRSPILFFEASKNLKFKKQRTPMAEVSITTRPGWNGITIPTDCYCFNINRNMIFNTNRGRLIHRRSDGSKSAIKSIEVELVSLNPWFNVLLNCYLKDEELTVTRFQNDDAKKSTDDKEGQIVHISNVGGRVFISFISSNNDDLIKIQSAIRKCNKLLPYTPKGVLIYRSDLKTLLELRFIGTELYDIDLAEEFRGDYLNKERIDYCVQNISKLSATEPEIIICSLFVKETCKLSQYVQNKLFFINNNIESLPLLTTIVDVEVENYNKRVNELKQSRKTPQGETSKTPELNLFEFPPRFIHPALLLHQKSLESILNWFSKHCNYAHVIRIIGHRILMKSTEIRQLQLHIQKEGKKIKKEMNLNFEAIPVPSKIYSRSYMTIKENPLWNYNDHFKVIVTTKEEAAKVHQFIKTVESELNKSTEENCASIAAKDLDGTLCCLYTCDDPDNPVLSTSPLTLYFGDKSTYTNRICRDCAFDSIQNAIFPYLNPKGMLEPDSVAYIVNKPKFISTIQSKSEDIGQTYWPQIPIGQFISLLINNDVKTSSSISIWLNIVSEFAIRSKLRFIFTFCPDHPHKIFRIDHQTIDIPCDDKNCNMQYCNLCEEWHDKNSLCQTLKDSGLRQCPSCKRITVKNGGCNHMHCICGCEWCYLCGKGFQTVDDCYAHLNAEHGGIFIEDELLEEDE